MHSTPLASPSATAHTPYSINVILMTLHATELARDIVEAGLRAAARCPGLCFTVAYGGQDADHGAWLQSSIDQAVEGGAEARLIRDVGILTRLRSAFDASKTWLLFVADDDPFSLNYLTGLARRSLEAGPEVATIAPTYYLGVAGNQTLLRRVEPMQGANAVERLTHFLANGSQQGIFYYALQRSVLVDTWLAYIETRPYTPSYLDQLLATWCTCHGNRMVVDEASVQLRDESGWVGFAACVRSDAKFYPLPAMTLFHELFWSADISRLLRHHPDFDALLPLLRKWMDARLTALVTHFDQRREVLQLPPDDEHKLMLHAVATTLRWVKGISAGPSFGAGLASLEGLAREVESAFLERLPAATTTQVAA
ncbi:MAG: hypothetical protein RIQ60_421 [Pseudomonadota bacterium]|jgi:hypothetical protein